MRYKYVFCFIFLIVAVSSIGCKQTNEQLIHEGVRLLNQGDNAGALKDFSEVIGRNSKLQVAYYDRALCYSNMKDYDKAIKDLNKILKLQGSGPLVMVMNPNSPFASEEDKSQVPRTTVLFERATVNYYIDSLKSSFSDFKSCLENNYQESKCYLWMGTIYIRTGNKAKGCDFYQKAKLMGDDEAEKMITGNCN
jgi:tetratricopeptide (TPR) repeat protein